MVKGEASYYGKISKLGSRGSVTVQNIGLLGANGKPDANKQRAAPDVTLSVPDAKLGGMVRYTVSGAISSKDRKGKFIGHM